VPWKDRDEDKDDESVWAIACLVVRKGFRQHGLTYPLVARAVEHARSRGAAAIEGDPLLTEGRQYIWDELNVGPFGPFLAAGFEEVSHPTKRRVVVRLKLM
jgi:GNAT superfamily N-acetyltransferase